MRRLCGWQYCQFRQCRGMGCQHSVANMHWGCSYTAWLGWSDLQLMHARGVGGEATPGHVAAAPLWLRRCQRKHLFCIGKGKWRCRCCRQAESQWWRLHLDAAVGLWAMVGGSAGRCSAQVQHPPRVEGGPRLHVDESSCASVPRQSLMFRSRTM